LAAIGKVGGHAVSGCARPIQRVIARRGGFVDIGVAADTTAVVDTFGLVASDAIAHTRGAHIKRVSLVEITLVAVAAVKLLASPAAVVVVAL